jgi:hypothetical protein
VKKETSSIYVLKEFDKKKSEKITKTENMKEANNWSILFNDINNIFESGNEEIIAKTLYNMKNSLSSQIGEADFDDKKLQLEELKNRLETMTSTKFIQAFSSKNLSKKILFVLSYI